MREFSRAREPLLKAECGGAWRSYVLRSHWRMVFPISRAHQARTAASLVAALKQNVPPIIHLVKFPVADHQSQHDFVRRGGNRRAALISKPAIPNNTTQPATLSFDHKTKTFSLPPNHYWAGGVLDIIEIFRTWLM